MSTRRHSESSRQASGLRRLVAVLSLLMFVFASVVHFPGLDDGDAPSIVSATTTGALDDADTGGMLTADHCHCVVAAPWPVTAMVADRTVPHAVPVATTHALATLHLENDGPPPKA